MRGDNLLLDQTIFYPQGGGEPADRSMIKTNQASFNVLDVRQVTNEVRHYVDIDPHTVKKEKGQCFVDKSRRLLNTKYHTAGHLLGNVVEDLYPGLKAVKGHSFPKEAYVEFQGSSPIDLLQIINALQTVIENNVSLQSFDIIAKSFEEEFYKLPYSVPDHKAFRAIRIGYYPPIPCGGTHVSSSGEIEGIQVGKLKEKNGIIRVSYEVF